MSNANEIYMERPCPSCMSANQTNAAIFSAPRAELLKFDEIKSYWSGFFKEKIFFSYHRCSLCDLLYCPTFFLETQLNKLYQSMSDNTAGVAIDILQKTQRNYFNFLNCHQLDSGDYLEFGPDIGLFTENCVQEGLFDKYWLLEPNKEVWPTLETRLNNKKFQVFANLSDIQSIPNQSISVVSMIHVLDHLLDPVKVLKDLKPKLTKGAKLLFVTHDERSLLAKLTKAKWPAYCMQHPQLYNPKTIQQLLKIAGYKVVDCQKSYNYFPITFLIKHVLCLFGLRRIKLPQLKKLQIGLKLGNIMTIASPEM